MGRILRGNLGGKSGYFFWIMFILRLWWKTIICVPWAIFPCWPTSRYSVFDIPVVLEKEGQGDGRVSAPFPYRSAICSMGLDRPNSSSAIQWILYKRDGNRKRRLDGVTVWERERLKGRKCRWNGSVDGSNDSLHVLFFQSVFVALVQDVFQCLSLIHFLVFPIRTVLTKSTNVSQM